MPGMTLPPGFRFHPTDEELVDYYLKKRVKNIPIEFDVIADVDLYKCEPWDLPSKSKLPHGDNEWFFFSPRDRKYPNGSRTNRATEAGYWKATGRDRTVRQGTKTIGMKKTLVFYRGRAPHGERTDWLMHEYRLDGEEWENMNVPQDAYVLCRVFKKNGFAPPKNPSGGSGSMEEGDQVDSPGEVNDDVKPSMTSLANLPPLSRPVSRGDVVSVEDHGATGADNFEMRPPAVFSDDPFVHNGSFRIHFSPDQDAGGFFLDEGLDKVRNDEQSLEDFYDICPPLEGSNLQLGDEDVYNDISGLLDPSKVVRSEFHKQWQEQAAGAYQAFGGQSFAKQEDYVSPLLHENGFEPLPNLVQWPSPPTVSQSVEENDTESSCVSSSNNFTTIRLRSRPSSVSSPAVGNGHSSPYSAIRRVLYHQRGISFSPSSPPVSESPPKLSAEQKLLNASKSADVELVSKQSLGFQVPAAEASDVGSEVASGRESSWATSVMCSPVPDVLPDEEAVDDSRSPFPSAGVTLAPSNTVVNVSVSSKPISENLPYVYTVSSEASPSVLDLSSPKSTMDEVTVKEVCFQASSGAGSVTRGPVEDVDQLAERDTLKSARTSVDKVAESSSPTKEFLASDSSSVSIMGLRLLAPICALRDFSAGNLTSASKKKLTSTDMPSGIGSIHVNAVTVTCSCSSAGLPHVPTKACACYTTFWEGRCEKEKQMMEENREEQASESRYNPAPCLTVGCVVFAVLIPVLSAQFFLFPALSAHHSSEHPRIRHSSLSFRDLLFTALGAVLFYLVQGRPTPWRWLGRRRGVHSRLSVSNT